jgi:hypothetical protein
VYNIFAKAILMKTTQIYLIVIGVLLWASYAVGHDNYREQQQKVEIHRQFCSLNTFHPNCK